VSRDGSKDLERGDRKDTPNNQLGPVPRCGHCGAAITDGKDSKTPARGNPTGAAGRPTYLIGTMFRGRREREISTNNIGKKEGAKTAQLTGRLRGFFPRR